MHCARAGRGGRELPIGVRPFFLYWAKAIPCEPGSSTAMSMPRRFLQLSFRALSVFAPFVLAACAASSVALGSPESVSDFDVDRYQFGMDRDCRDEGTKRGESASTVDAFCNCVYLTLQRNLTRSDWRRAVYLYLNGREREEYQVLAPVMSTVGACRALPPPPEGGSLALTTNAASLVGSWEWFGPANQCREVYTFRENGTARVESGNERTENTYLLSDKPEPSGRVKLTLTATKYFSGRNCEGLQQDATDRTLTLYVLFGPEKRMLAVCKSAADLDCIGPLKKSQTH